ncbi:MAG: 2Fe-2S iron-sulfur cluster-binding protein [Elusimicrobiota bacterium]
MDLEAERGWTILDAARFLGLEIPTLCHEDGLSPYGGCRLCLVEIGKGPRARLVTACTYPVEEGLFVRTNSQKVIRTRRMNIELLLASCPSSKTIQDLAAQFGVQKVRFKVRHDDCILCGLCVRMCEEQMMAKAIGFVNRGHKKRITTPFDAKSDVCRRCGGCMYICPVCSSRCQGPEASNTVCGSCLSMQPTCVEVYDDYQCYLGPTGSCGTCVRKEEGTAKKAKQSPIKEKVTSGGKRE